MWAKLKSFLLDMYISVWLNIFFTSTICKLYEFNINVDKQLVLKMCSKKFQDEVTSNDLTKTQNKILGAIDEKQDEVK